MLNPRTRYGLSALVCASATVLAFMATATRYNPTFEGDRIEVLASDLSVEIGRPVRGRLGARDRKLVLEISYTPRGKLYVKKYLCRRQMKNLMELAAIHYTGFADEIEVRAEPAGNMPLIGEVPEARRISESVAELRRRFDRKKILASGNRIWALDGGIGYAPWKYIVLHHSGANRGSAASFDRHHRQVRGWDCLAYHFVIGNGNGSRDGQIEAGSRWTRQREGAHAGVKEYNEGGIGICLVGNFATYQELAEDQQGRLNPGQGTRPTRKQMESLRFLVLYLALRLGISADNIKTHREIKRTICPGGNFPHWDFVDDVSRHLERLRQAER